MARIRYSSGRSAHDIQPAMSGRTSRPPFLCCSLQTRRHLQPPVENQQACEVITRSIPPPVQSRRTVHVDVNDLANGHQPAFYSGAQASASGCLFVGTVFTASGIMAQSNQTLTGIVSDVACGSQSLHQEHDHCRMHARCVGHNKDYRLVRRI